MGGHARVKMLADSAGDLPILGLWSVLALLCQVVALAPMWMRVDRRGMQRAGLQSLMRHLAFLPGNNSGEIVSLPVM